MVDNFTKKAIEAVFDLIKQEDKANRLDSHMGQLDMPTDFFSFHAFISMNEGMIVRLLDWYFYEKYGDEVGHPDGDLGGLVSYALYDAATPYIGDRSYNLKCQEDFELYLTHLEKKES